MHYISISLPVANAKLKAVLDLEILPDVLAKLLAPTYPML